MQECGFCGRELIAEAAKVNQNILIKHGDTRFSNIKELDAEDEDEESEDVTTEESVAQERKASEVQIPKLRTNDVMRRQNNEVTELENMLIRDADEDELEEFKN